MATAATDVKKMLAFQQRERKVLKMVEPLVALSNAWVLSSMLEVRFLFLILVLVCDVPLVFEKLM